MTPEELSGYRTISSFSPTAEVSKLTPTLFLIRTLILK